MQRNEVIKLAKANVVKNLSQEILQELATIAELEKKKPTQKAELMESLKERTQVLLKRYVNHDPELALLDSVFIGEWHIYPCRRACIYRRAFVIKWDKKKRRYYNAVGETIGSNCGLSSSFDEKERKLTGDGVVIKIRPSTYYEDRFQNNLTMILAYFYERSGSIKQAIEDAKKLVESLRDPDDINGYNYFLDALLKAGE